MDHCAPRHPGLLLAVLAALWSACSGELGGAGDSLRDARPETAVVDGGGGSTDSAAAPDGPRDAGDAAAPDGPRDAGDATADDGPLGDGPLGDGPLDDGPPTQLDAAPPCAPTLTTGGARGKANVMVRGSYDYVPSVMKDGVYRMWWCAGVAGDHILYAEADKLDGPWHAPGSSVAGSSKDVFGPSSNQANFDGVHTCDPSVIRVNGTYYMYYGGLGDSGSPADTTRIGVAKSADGLSWTRLNGGKPIVVPARDHNSVPNGYGAGQPSAAHVGGKFYLIFTDTTGLGSNKVNGAGQYVLRSADPTFQQGVEELGPGGFAPYDPATHTSHSLFGSFSVDWQYVDTLDAFVVASHTAKGVTRMHFFDKSLTSQLGEVKLTSSWTEGPGLVSRPDGHAVPHGSCGTVPLDVVYSSGPGGPSTWDLSHSGADLKTGLDCSCVDRPRVLEGSFIDAAGKPLTLVRGGKRLQFALAAPAAYLARTHCSVSSSVFYSVPFGASMHSGDKVLGASGRPPAFLLDGNTLWPASCLGLITANQSSISTVSTAQWDAHPQGPSLYCIQ